MTSRHELNGANTRFFQFPNINLYGQFLRVCVVPGSTGLEWFRYFDRNGLLQSAQDLPICTLKTTVIRVYLVMGPIRVIVAFLDINQELTLRYAANKH